MPHVIVKMLPGRTEQQKQDLTVEITKALTRTVGAAESWISIGIEEVSQADWDEKVRTPDILKKPDSIYKHAG